MAPPLASIVSLRTVMVAAHFNRAHRPYPLALPSSTPPPAAEEPFPRIVVLVIVSVPANAATAPPSCVAELPSISLSLTLTVPPPSWLTPPPAPTPEGGHDCPWNWRDSVHVPRLGAARLPLIVDPVMSTVPPPSSATPAP